jgi:dihydrofolate synthase/folylpolyglutamate synthase
MSSATPSRGGWLYTDTLAGDVWGELGGLCQEKNAATILTAVAELRNRGYNIPDEAVREGFAHVTTLTGLQGRWQKIADAPLTICDTGHNIGGMQYIAQQLANTPCRNLRIVLGMVNDKDISGVLSLLPRHAQYYFTQASVARALSAQEVADIATQFGLQGNCYDKVATAYAAAQKDACEDDLIFVGGSTFVVADLIKQLSE